MSNKTKRELEAEISELKARVALQDQTIARLLTAPPAPQFLPMPYPMPYPVPVAPAHPPLITPTYPPYFTTITRNDRPSGPSGGSFVASDGVKYTVDAAPAFIPDGLVVVNGPPLVFGKGTIRNTAGCAEQPGFHVQQFAKLGDSTSSVFSVQ